MATQMPQKKQTLVLRRIDDPDAVAPTTKVTYNESLSGTPKNNFGNAQPATGFNAKARRRRTTGPSIADGPTAAAAANATSSSRFNEVRGAYPVYIYIEARPGDHTSISPRRRPISVSPSPTPRCSPLPRSHRPRALRFSNFQTHTSTTTGPIRSDRLANTMAAQAAALPALEVWRRRASRI